MNRYRIFEEVPKKKVRKGKGQVLVQRLTKRLKRQGINPKVRYQQERMKDDLTETISTYCRAARTHLEPVGFYEITWKENER